MPILSFDKKNTVRNHVWIRPDYWFGSQSDNKSVREACAVDIDFWIRAEQGIENHI